MRYLGLDLGTKTLGISLSDQSGVIANTYGLIKYDGDVNELIEPLKEIVLKNDVEVIVLGLPKNMNNSIGPRAEATLDFKKLLEKNLKIVVEMQDERLSTKEATNYLIEANMSRKKRKNKVDVLAANIILQTYLNKKKGMDL